MADKRNDSSQDKDQPQPTPPPAPPKPLREVVVTHLDEPPSIGKEIHPRRPAPIVPTREQRISQEADDEKQADPKDSSENQKEN